MNNLTRWDPFHELASLQDRMNRLFTQQPFAPFGNVNEESLTQGSFVPPVDVYEDEHSIQLKMEVPGIDEKNIDIRLENNLMTVRGEREFNKETKEENYHRIERRYGSFSRSFTLPNTVNPEDVKADYDKGVLTIRLGKRAEAKPKQIKVSVGEGAKTIESASKSTKSAA
jgi:HSP20 family protein